MTTDTRLTRSFIATVCLLSVSACNVSGTTSAPTASRPALQPLLAPRSESIPALCDGIAENANFVAACSERFRSSPPLIANQSLTSMNAHYAYARGATGRGSWIGIREGLPGWPGGLVGEGASAGSLLSIYSRSPVILHSNLDNVLPPELLLNSPTLAPLRGAYVFLSTHVNLSTGAAVANNHNVPGIGQGVAPEAGLVIFGGLHPLAFPFPTKSPVPLTGVYSASNFSLHVVRGTGAQGTSLFFPGGGIQLLDYTAQYEAILRNAGNLVNGNRFLPEAVASSQISKNRAERIPLVFPNGNDGRPGNPTTRNARDKLYRKPYTLGTSLPLLLTHPHLDTLELPELLSLAENLGVAASSRAEFKQSMQEIRQALEEVTIASAAMQDSVRIASYSNLCGTSANWCLASPVQHNRLNEWTVTTSDRGRELVLNRDSFFAGSGLGTSVSAPYALGALAVVHSRFPNLAPVEVAIRLKATARLDGLRPPSTLPGDCNEIGALYELADLKDSSLLDSSGAPIACTRLNDEQMLLVRRRLTFGRGLIDLKAATEPMGTMAIPMGQDIDSGTGASLAQSQLRQSSTALGDGLSQALRGQTFMALDTLATPFHYATTAAIHTRLPDRFQHADLLPADTPTSSPVIRMRSSLSNPSRTTVSFALSDQLAVKLSHDATPALMSGISTLDTLALSPVQQDSAFAAPWADNDTQWQGGGLQLRMGEKHRLSIARLSLSSAFAGSLPNPAPVTAEQGTASGLPEHNHRTRQASVLSWQTEGPTYRLGLQWVNSEDSHQLLGLSASGGLGQFTGAYSRAANSWGRHSLGRNADFLWSLWQVQGEASLGAGAALHQVRNMRADAWSIALSATPRSLARSRWVWRLEQPLRLYTGQIQLLLPVSRTRYREIIYSNLHLTPEPSGRELRTQLDWHLSLGRHRLSLLQFSAGWARQPEHIRTAESEPYAAVRFTLPLH